MTNSACWRDHDSSGGVTLWIIPMDDILYITSHGRLSDLHCRDGDKVVSLLNDDDGTELPVGRSYLNKLRSMME